jgi:SAM-dependent methyltransferase
VQPKNYTDNFFEYHLQGAIASAEIIIPLVKEYINPVSVIDVGCGIGAWLSVWKKNGTTGIFGIDGGYIDTSKLMIDKSEFSAVDLEKGFDVNRKYDLVCCLEVAEHLPVNCAELFIKLLCNAGDVVLFSAAIPGQEGTLHLNEQYTEYWSAIFKSNGYISVDCLRRRIWNDKRIQWWYRQNILFFVKESSLEMYPPLKLASSLDNNSNALSFINPELFEYKNRKIDKYESILKSKTKTLKYLLNKILKRNSL